jgi:hypothetical protein
MIVPSDVIGAAQLYIGLIVAFLIVASFVSAFRDRIYKALDDAPQATSQEKRKNADPALLGDDGELIFPDHYRNHIED